MHEVSPTDLRTRFSASLSSLYGSEVPAYTTLVEVSQEVNQRVLADGREDAERLGSIERVTAERHGAIRVGSPCEMAQVARIFGAVGMKPVGFYDLRAAPGRPIPVVSTAFRPTSRGELAENPFRVFTSMLVLEDRRFFDADLEQRLRNFLGSRRLFPDELLELADAAERNGGLADPQADRFIQLATASFALSSDPVDRAWYGELEQISGVAADIGGVTTTHINHLTPRVLDIDELYRRMRERGIDMIDRIQGPPRWTGPDVLLRQTSFRALAEPRRFRDHDGTITTGKLRVRFGEVESRGIALTPAGRDLYDRAVREIDSAVAADRDAGYQDVAARVWSQRMPDSEYQLRVRGFGYFTYHRTKAHPTGPPPRTLEHLVAGGWVEPRPIVYEDFLPRSAAGIFASNLSGAGTVDRDAGGAHRDAAWLADAIARPVHAPEALYAAEEAASLEALAQEFRLAPHGHALQ